MRNGGRVSVAKVVIGLILARGCFVAAFAAAQAAPAAQDAAPASTLSSELQPRLHLLDQAIAGLEIDRWRATKTVKEAMTANIESTRRDLQQTLPGLVSTADAAPASVPALLQVSRNLGALYDVVLRVTVVADSAAPQPQAQAMADALAGLDVGRRELNIRLESAAEAQDTRAAELQKTVMNLKAAATTPPFPAPVCPPQTPAKKKKPAPKPPL